MQTVLLPIIGQRVERSKRKKPQNHSSGLISSLWEFDQARGARSSFYRWYGTLPEELIERLFDLYMPPNGAVVDLFLGTGSTLGVAKRRNLRAVGIDANPIACAISKLRIDPVHLEAGDFARLRTLILAPPHKPQLIEDFTKRYAYSSRWFDPTNLTSVLNILANTTSLNEKTFKLVMLAIAAVTRDFANINTRCTHHLVYQEKGALPVAEMILERLSLLLVDETSSDEASSPAENQVIALKSACDTELPAREFDLSVLHPPYLGVIHYHNIHRVAMDLLHYADHLNSIANSPFFYENIRNNDLSTDNEAKYHEAMRRTLAETIRITKDNGTIVLIMGDHRFKGRLRHPVTRLTLELEDQGFLLHERFIWMLNNNSGMHVKRKGHYIDHNYVCVFRR